MKTQLTKETIRLKRKGAKEKRKVAPTYSFATLAKDFAAFALNCSADMRLANLN